MTYRELAAEIDLMTPEQLDNDVTVYDSTKDEYYKIDRLDTAEVTDVLDEGHPYLI